MGSPPPSKLIEVASPVKFPKDLQNKTLPLLSYSQCLAWRIAPSPLFSILPSKWPSNGVFFHPKQVFQ